VTDDPKLEDDSERLAKVLGNVLQLSANEGLVAAQLEAFAIFHPMPAELDLTKGSALQSKLSYLSTALGGPPRLIITKQGETPPQFDTYADAAIREAIDAFMLARSSVCRTHIYLIGSALIKQRPELMNLPQDPEIRRIIVTQVEAYFWEHTETSYIRLASFWDRVGQLLDFAFFNIRQYEHDGFYAVMERISKNFIAMNQTNVRSATWARLRKFQTSGQPDGLQWLLSRRNLLVHSLHLRPPRENEPDNPIFTSAYNHLDQAVRNKLRQGTAEEEVSLLHQHLSAAATLFPDAVEVALTESPSAGHA
jgi:hypothetical protein